MYQFIISPTGGRILKLADEQVFIPIDENNTDYQQYLAWVAEGNTAEEWNPQG